MGVQTSEGVFEYYRYTPSIPAAAISASLFSITTALHIYQLVCTRIWILLPIVIGGIRETAAYATRIVSIKQSPSYTLGLFIMQSTPTLLAPALFAATIYMCLGRIIRAIQGEKLSLVRTEHLTIFFVLGDVLGLAIQGVGAVVMPLGTLEEYYIGEKIIIAGLVVLVFSFGIFIAITLVFDQRIRRAPTPRSGNTNLNWRKELLALYTGSSLILVRSIFRLIEYSQGNSGWLMSHEWTLYFFDTALMFAVLILFNVAHPSHVQAILRGGKFSEMGGTRITEVELELGNSGSRRVSKRY